MKQYVKLTGNSWSRDIHYKIVPVTSEGQDYWESKTVNFWFMISKNPNNGNYGELVDAPKEIDTSELDALAEKIYSANPKWLERFTEHLSRDHGSITPSKAYTLAQDFLDYKKSRVEK